jgi:hypothetical protein
MDQKDLKKINLVLSSSLTLTLEAGINIISNTSYRQVLNPIAILVSFFLGFVVTHQIKCYSCNLLIKNNNEEISQATNPAKIIELQKENSRLKKTKSKLELF